MKRLFSGALFVALVALAWPVSAQTFTTNLGSVEEALGACKGGPAAFPGARGFGQCAVGWRGGRIVRVTNTNDSGAGSFRDECIETEGPRVCIFDVGGTITNQSQLQLGNPESGNLYIAGQSAPEDSGGIQIKLDTDGPNLSALAFAQTEHILVRHIRLRPGPGDLSGIGNSISGILLRNVKYGMFNNISVQYAADQNITSVADAFTGLLPIRGITRYITWQRVISAYGLQNSNHTSGGHSKAALHCSASLFDLQNGDRCDHISLIENLYATTNDRMPELQGAGGPYQVTGNLTYNAASAFVEIDADDFPGTTFDFTNNFAKEGPETRNVDPPTLINCRDDLGTGVATCNIYSNNNLVTDFRPTPQSGAESLALVQSATLVNVSTPHAPEVGSSSFDPERLEIDLLPLVGATAPARDDLDAKIVAEVTSRTGAIPDDPTDITGTGLTGGYPTLAAGTPPTDTDGDGMPDDWEFAFQNGFFLATQFDAWGDRDGDGWSNLEEYLNFRAGDIPDPRP